MKLSGFLLPLLFAVTSLFAGAPEYFQIAGGAKVTGFLRDGNDIWLATYGNGIFRKAMCNSWNIYT